MEYLTIGDAAVIAKMSTRTVRRAISRGEIPAYKVGGGLRLVQDDVHAWLTARPLITTKRT
jgi:excisionase family DNA binding protein